MKSKKEIEQLVLDAARDAGVPIPDGGVFGEEPDFRFHTDAGDLGIDVFELLRPACTNHGILPLEQENFHQKILDAAREECEKQGLPSLRVQVYFTNPRGKKQDWKNLTRSLVDVVVANYEKAQPAWSQTSRALPDDFQHVLIVRDDDPWWWSPTAGGISLSQIPMHLASCIAAKEARLPAYRQNLPIDAKVWLLLHSGVTVARSVEVPHGINEWRFPFEFDRVFWFSFLGSQFAEIQRAPKMDYTKPWTRVEFVCECGTRCGIDVELDDGQFSGHAYQHPCGTTQAHYVPGRIIRMLEEPWNESVAIKWKTRGGVTFLNYITVGTDHKLQKSDSRDTGLKDLLSTILQNNDVALIAEEVKTSKPVNTFGRELVGEDRWLSIDMNDQERKDAGIYDTTLHGGAPVCDPRTGNDFPANEYHQVSEGKRENHWLDKIEQWCKAKGLMDETVVPMHKTIVLVCGHNHLPFVGAKISERGHSVVQLEYLPYNKEQAQGLFTIFNN